MEESNLKATGEPIPGAEITLEQEPRKVTNIPRTDVDLMDVSQKIHTSWKANPQITLIWTTEAQFGTLVTDYSNVLMERKTTGSIRPEVTLKAEALDVEINSSIEYIKGYLTEKYNKKDAISYYSQFGIVKTNKGYKLPADRDKRKTALAILLKAITTHGFQNNTYGLTYWTNIKTKFDSLFEQAGSIDSVVTDKVSNKNQLKTDVRKTLNAIIRAIRANYPDTYKSVLRNWGFQKEKY